MTPPAFYRHRLALVVGGSQGIGRAIAEALVARDCHVVLGARRSDVLEATRQALADHAPGIRVTTRSMDVADPIDVRQAVDRVIAEVGAPDFLFNCAGLARPGWFHDTSDQAFDEMMRVNYLGTVHVCRAVMPHLLARGSGFVVNTASLGGLFGLYGYTGYCGSKFAVVGFTEALRRELAGSGVVVSLLCPPNTRTPGLIRENQEKPAEVLAQEEKVRAVEPYLVARRLLDALPRRQAVIIPTLDGRVAWWLSRWAPWVLDLLLARPRATSAHPAPRKPPEDG